MKETSSSITLPYRRHRKKYLYGLQQTIEIRPATSIENLQGEGGKLKNQLEQPVMQAAIQGESKSKRMLNSIFDLFVASLSWFRQKNYRFLAGKNIRLLFYLNPGGRSIDPPSRVDKQRIALMHVDFNPNCSGSHITSFNLMTGPIVFSLLLHSA